MFCDILIFWVLRLLGFFFLLVCLKYVKTLTIWLTLICISELLKSVVLNLIWTPGEILKHMNMWTLPKTNLTRISVLGLRKWFCKTCLWWQCQSWGQPTEYIGEESEVNISKTLSHCDEKSMILLELQSLQLQVFCPTSSPLLCLNLKYLKHSCWKSLCMCWFCSPKYWGKIEEEEKG